MSIVGEPFKKYVADQIKVRQGIYGSGVNQNLRTPEEIQYLNSRNAWVKLASSVFIDTGENGKKRLKQIGQSGQTGTRLARKYILFNGIGQKGNKAGITGNDRAYGVGGTEFGYSPMPGIIDASIESLNRGSIKKSTVNIKANNREQFDIIDVLYLRLGYTVMLEWGNDKYFDNNGNYQSMGSTIIDSEFLFGSGARNNEKSPISTSELLAKIEKKRSETSGNYDAIIGTVVNFTWTLESDLSYSIKLDIISKGDVIESLTTNQINVKESPFYFRNIKQIQQDLTNNSGSTAYTGLNQNLVKGYTGKHNNRWSRFDLEVDYWLKKNNGQVRGSIINPGLSSAGQINVKDTDGNNFIFGRDLSSHPDFKDLSINFPGSADYILTIMNGGEKYVRLGALLEFFNNNLIPIANGEPLIKINTDEDKNICYILNNQIISVDPRVCIVRNIGFLYGGTQSVELFRGLRPFQFKLARNNKIRWGKTMNIYINNSYIRDVLFGALQDKEGKINLYSLLSTLLNDINLALGSVNQLEAVVEEETNQIKIIDNSTIPGKEELYDYLGIGNSDYVLEVYGYNNGNSNFIKNAGIQTSITKEYASMITIGATREGYVPGEESTAFSKWNSGIIDRFKSKLEDPEANSAITGSNIDKYEDIKKQYATFLTSRYGVIGLGPNAATTNKDMKFMPDTITFNRDTMKGYNEYLHALNASAKNVGSNQTGFIPFNLQLDMDGLSGVRIYQKLNVNTNFLPSNYPDTLEFVVTKVNHLIKDNYWQTSLDSMAIAITSPATITPRYSGTGSTSSSTPSIPPEERITKVRSPITSEELNRSVRRMKIRRFLDDGRQTLGKMQIYGSDGTTELFELTTIELPYKGNKNNISCIPPGKYLVRPNNDSTFGQYFWVVGQEANNYIFNKIIGNSYTRDSILIHGATTAFHLKGCIGPGKNFSTDTAEHKAAGLGGDIVGNLKGNPFGVGANAMNKIRNTLWKPGDATTNSFFLEIENNSPLLTGENNASKLMDATGIPTVFIDTQIS